MIQSRQWFVAPRPARARWRTLAQSAATALVAYIVAAGGEALFIWTVRPTEWELTWISDVVLAIAFAVAVYLWLHLRATRRELTAHERAELVIQTQLSMAAEMQRRLLPPIPSSDCDFEWAASLVSAGKIGGDFYDFIEQAPGVWLVLVADVSGKGIPAAMALGSLRSAFHMMARGSDNPAELMTRLSAAVQAEWLGEPYVTCVVGRFATKDRALTYANAGHPAGVLIGASAIRYLNRGGPPLGLLAGARFEDETVDLAAGDICLFVSDGVTEALGGDTWSSLDTIGSIAREHSGSARSTCDAVMACAQEGHGPAGVEGWEDDRTVVVIRVGGGQPAEGERR